MNSKNSSNSYKSILKGTSIFGGVQIFNIVINLIRGKFVAVILGPEGMGIASLFTSSSATIQRFASLGLNQAIVRETAAADGNDDRNRIISTTLRLITATALLGGLICVIFCLPLSRLTFGTPDYAWQFALLGVAVALSVAYTGKLAILQGLHQVKKISKASVVGGLTGLLVGVPLYYIFGDKGIVPAIVVLSLALFLFYSFSLKNAGSLSRGGFRWKENYPLIRRLLLLGCVLMASDLIGSLVTYLINLFLRIKGSIDDVGLYQAANSVTYQYSGLVFAAMAMDYFPRLSRVSQSNKRIRFLVNRQTEIVSLIIAPAICLLILSAPLFIKVLLSGKFISIIPLMRWMGLGILLKALSYPMGYIAFAKGNRKVFFLLEGVTCNLLLLTLSCLFFYFFGLIGLGYAMVAENLITILIYFIINNRLYHYNFSLPSLMHALIALIFGTATFVFSFFDSAALTYSLMGCTSAGAILWCFLSLKKKLAR